MKYINSDKSKKQLIAQYLNDLKSANPEKIGKALLDLFFADYPTIEEEAKKFESNKNNFIKFVSIYIRAMKGKFDYVIKLADFITDESEYVRKIAIAGINSLFQEKIITHDYIQIKELKNEYDNIKDKLIKLKDVVRWDEKKKYIYHKIIVHTEYKEGTSNKYNPFIEKKKNLGYLILNISLCYIFCLNGYVYSQYYRLLPKNHIKNFGIYLYNLNNKEEIFALNPHKSFIPASNLKLLLLGAFLQNSDININLCNKFYITEDNNFIEINIYGGGAFNFDYKNYSKEFEMFLNKNKNILANKIIKKINLDSSMFDSKTKNIYWNEHDKLEWWLPTVSPFILNSNLLNLKISYKKGRLTTKQLPFEFLDNIDISSIYCARKCNLNLLKAEYTTPTSVKLSGPICCNNTIIKQIPVESPVLYYTKALINYLQNNDIHFSGETTFKKIDNQNNPNFEYCSSLKELFQHLLKSSDNLVAETLLKYLGYIKYHEGSFDKGSLAIFEFVKSLGINEETSIYDGAGISRLNKVSPYALVKTLEFIYEKLGNDIYRMLPKGGEKNTTLRGRFKKFPAIVYAKTGFINDVFALTGIVKKGRTNYLFSILYNGKLKKWSAYSIQEKILKEMIKN